ncbi:DUF1566 domain-containing protein [Brumicola pallidula]|nr:DUF1566 domain-containing protein [Glaciecola pallidula]
MIKNVMLNTALLCVVGFVSAVNAQQFCLSTAPISAPEENFLTLDNGQLLHLSTNLIWMRCAIGQEWVGESCTGEAEPYTWKQALELSVGYQFNASSNWRLPNIKELSSITERSCTRPSINTDLFPATPPDDFWTSTPSLTDAERAWVVAFFNSSNSIKEKSRTVFVRLVRTALPAERDID